MYSGFFSRQLDYWYDKLPNCPSTHVVFSLSNGIEDLCRWPTEQLNTTRNTEEQISKASGEQGVGLHRVGSFRTPAGAGWGAIVLATLLPNANRIRRRRAPSPQNPRLFLACPVWSGVLRIFLSCFQKPETRPRGRLWVSIWGTS